MAEKYRPARVTIEARVTEELGSLWVDTGPTPTFAPLTINLDRKGVTVEYLPEPREWRDGDVVQYKTYGVAERMGGAWYLAGREGEWEADPAISTDVKLGSARVLRYQAGEEQE